MHPHGDRSDDDKVYYPSETTLLVNATISDKTSNFQYTNNIEENSLEIYIPSSRPTHFSLSGPRITVAVLHPSPRQPLHATSEPITVR